ncbi:RING-type domain-containing protein [Mycena chlorophos]|uniref:RING-type domain-containing protein n=1 Tax=Mycena chlorophos TaxID=658473 RepID=A0A8H6W0M0_MYCCL|nr:RING-type domain-containing protein [Mycena chlorophos]
MYSAPRPTRYSVSPAHSSPLASRWTTPNTPSTPASSYYAPGPATPATPDNFRLKRLSFSPEVRKAPATDNWRSRASQHGIRVDDDDDDEDPSDASFEAPLLPPFLTAPRRRALSYASENIPHTPPRNTQLASKLRLQGSVTAPAHERRAFGLKSNLPDVDEHVELHCDVLPPGPIQTQTYTHCSSCAVASKQLAMLSPCSHVLCPSCLTSALNIVDQLSMHCVVCRDTVDTFGLVRPPTTTAPAIDDNFLLPFSPPASPSPDEDPVVLRIDNVPWDITPPAILTFLGVNPASGARAFVLLDRLGKTQSHAFVEVPTEAMARSVLRGEHRAAPVLGSGRRARAVTVTRSSQSSLMAGLFPSWAGAFDGSVPSLAGVAGSSLPNALEGGLMRESELTDLLYLMRTQDARFVKVPNLPFYALVNILAKFPTDRDSRVFWTASLRDLLYDVSYAAIQVLQARKATDEDEALIKELVRTGMGCHAFTEQQLRGLYEFDTPSAASSQHDEEEVDEDAFHARFSASTSLADASPAQASSQCQTFAPPSSPYTFGSISSLPPSSPSPPPAAASTPAENDGSDSPIDAVRMSELAAEFGVERELVEALAARLGLSA